MDGDLLLHTLFPHGVGHSNVTSVLATVSGTGESGLEDLLVGVDNASHLVLDLVTTFDLSGLLGVGTDGSVYLSVEFLKRLGLVGLKALDPATELLLVLGGIRLFKLVHVDLDVETEDLVSVLLALAGLIGVLSLLLSPGLAGSWVSPGGMWNVKSSIAGALQAAEDPGAGCGSGKTDVEDSHEWPAFREVLVGVPVFSGGLFESLIQLVHTELLEKSSGKEKTSAVSSGVIS